MPRASTSASRWSRRTWRTPRAASWTRPRPGSCAIILPVDAIVAFHFEANAPSHAYGVDAIPADGMMLDVGAQSIERIKGAIDEAATLVWNGPIGRLRAASVREGHGRDRPIRGGADQGRQARFGRRRRRYGRRPERGGRRGTIYLCVHSRRRFPGMDGGQTVARGRGFEAKMTPNGVRCRPRRRPPRFPIQERANESRRPQQSRRGHDRARQGHSRRRRVHRHHQEALRRHQHRMHRGQPARLSRDDVPRGRGHEAHLRRDPLRRNDLAEGQGRHAAGRHHQEGRLAPRHQGRRRHQAAAELPGRDRSPSASTSSPTGCRSTTSRARASPNGAP